MSSWLGVCVVGRNTKKRGWEGRKEGKRKIRRLRRKVCRKARKKIWR